MTDETYTFISDVKEKKSVARSGGKKGKSRRGCTLPSDNLSTKEKRQMNGDMVSISMDRPMSYAKFQSLSAEVQKEYLQHIIDTYGGNTGRIAGMFGVEESQVKKLRQDLNIISRYSIGDIGYDYGPWIEFLGSADFLKKPMTWETFKALDKFDQQDYINYIFGELKPSAMMAEKMFGTSISNIRIYCGKRNIVIPKAPRGPAHPRDFSAWNAFIGEYVGSDEHPTPLEEAVNELANFKAEPVQLKGPEKIEFLTPADIAPTVKEINIEFVVEKVEDIKLLLGVIPKADKGTITFRFGY